MKILKYLQKEYGITQVGNTAWSHAVNSQEKFGRILNTPDIMFIESDIRISKQGVAVAAHPPETEGDLTFKSLIFLMNESKQGLKLDFKDPEILERCLQQLQKTPLPQPVLLNADILQGNGANPSKFSPVGFLALCQRYYPQGILSVGWTTTANPDQGYTRKNVDDMLALVEGMDEITFPVRACLLPGSWDQLQRLLDREGRTLSIWNNEPVSDQLRDWIKSNTDPAKTFYDFIDDNKDPLKFW